MTSLAPHSERFADSKRAGVSRTRPRASVLRYPGWTMRSRSPLLFAVPLTFASFACGRGSPPPSAPSDKLGQAVGFSLPSDEGALVTMPLPGARATVLDFFGPTCEPCKRSVPAIHARRAELAQKGAKLVLVGVLADGERLARRSQRRAGGPEGHSPPDPHPRRPRTFLLGSGSN